MRRRNSYRPVVTRYTSGIHAGCEGETIVEYIAGAKAPRCGTEAAGGRISFRQLEDGRIRIHVYGTAHTIVTEGM